jgi:3,4-dihydroxy 2-butanone 4-phosphate synthase/GTP cyclohydrolase II
MVVVADDQSRENESDLIMAAQHMDETSMAFFLRHGSGLVCAPMTNERADELQLDLMVSQNTESHGTAFTVTVDHESVGTGISAHDRALTIRALADGATKPGNLRRPGHVFPLRSRPFGVLKRPGHTEAGTDLVRLATGSAVAAITELVGDDGIPLDGPSAKAFAKRNGLVFLEIADLVRYRRRTERLVERVGEANLPTEFGDFRVIAYRSQLDDVEHIALTMGNLAVAEREGQGLLVRVHSECITGDLFTSRRCDCGAQLSGALKLIATEGAGVLIYLRGHEGRGIGLGHKLRAYALQECGRDTVDANVDLGLPVDDREYGIGALMLADLGVHRIRLITNNPHKYSGLEGYDLELADRVALPPAVTADNIAYLRTKRDRMGHLLELPLTVHG